MTDTIIANFYKPTIEKDMFDEIYEEASGRQYRRPLYAGQRPGVRRTSDSFG
jgi:hypothetical protein